jgi:DNA-directed RNA polymerase subunit F
LDAQVSALTEVKAVLAKVAKAEQEPALQQEIQQALALKQAVAEVMPPTSAQKVVSDVVSATKLAKEIATRMQQQGQQVTPGAEAKLAEDLVQAYQQMSQVSATGLPKIEKENADLRGQVAFLKGKLDARGGRDYPPCWADEHTGKVEFIFDIMMSAEGLTVSPAWPKQRAADVLAFPTTAQLISPIKHPLSEFSQLANPIFTDSKAKNCRHYVVLRSNIADTATFNRYRYHVENMFYKVER